MNESSNRATPPPQAAPLRTLPFRSPAAERFRPHGAPAPYVREAAELPAPVHEDAPAENHAFHYGLVAPPGARDAIILLHGLNERSWEKYLPWAHTLAERSGRAVILFPLAFHMDRAPAAWSAARPMHALSRTRRARFPGLSESSFANAALSTRLQARPDRFVWAGLQTVADLTALVGEIREGRHPVLPAGARVDVFAYSIGTLVAQVVLMADPDALFSDTRAFLFCGGCVLEDSNPVSRYIVDSAAGASLRRFFTDDFEEVLARRPELVRVLEQDPVGVAFRTLLRRDLDQDGRLGRLAALAPRLRAVALERDAVMPGRAVEETLAPAGVPAEVLDFGFEYDHVEPFPAQAEPRARALATEAVFGRAAAFLAPAPAPGR